MKKIFSTILILSTVLSITSCKYEEDDIWNQSAAERIETISKNYAETLMNSKGGWAMQYYPTNSNSYPSGNGYLLMAKFADKGTVTMGMKNVFSSNAYREDVSTWDINKDQGPVLSFSSYNTCIHVFADPYDLPFTGTKDDEVNEEGKGAQGDYEFSMIEVPTDGNHILLMGKKRNSYTYLTPVPEGTDFKTYIEDCQKVTADFFPTTNPLEYQILLPDSTIDTYQFSSGLTTLYPAGTDRVMTGIVNSYLITNYDGKYYLRFRDALKLKDGSKINNFVYNKEEDVFKGVENENCKIVGPDMATFIESKFDDGRSWAMMNNTDMSTKYLAIYTALVVDFKNILKADIKGITLRKNNGKLSLAINYGAGIRPQSVIFNIDSYTLENGKFSIGNVTTDTDNGKKILETKAMQSLVNSLKQPNTISPATTQYNPNVLRLDNDNDAELWLTITLK